MSTLVTINGSDLPTNSRADINGNFSTLNTDKEEVSNKSTDSTFASADDTTYPTTLATKKYVDAGGNVNASTTNKGIVEEATQAEVDAGTATGGTGARLFVNPSALPRVDRQVFTATGAGVWTKPNRGNVVWVQVWGGGGSGGRGNASSRQGGGGGGGAYVEKWFDIDDLGATEQVSVATGGAAQTTADTAGNVGGNSTFGASSTLVTAYGGGGGEGNGAGGGGGGGGGIHSAGSTGSTTAGGNGGNPRGYSDAVTTATSRAGTGGAVNVHGSNNQLGGGGGAGGGNTGDRVAGDSVYGGGGGGSGTDVTGNGGAGGNSVYGGGGGGGTLAGAGSAGAGGLSVHGGNGGAGSKGTTVGVSGSQPGGGGGGSCNANSGAGGNGKVVVTVF